MNLQSVLTLVIKLSSVANGHSLVCRDDYK